MSDSRPADLLSGLKTELEERERLGRRRERVRENLEKLEERLRGLRKRLAKEGEDVARLEKTSLRSLFHSAIGDRDERLRKERTEHLAARSELLAAVSEKRTLEKELAGIETGLKHSIGAEQRHAAALRELETTDGTAKEVLAICERKGHAGSALRETDEAIRAAGAVATALAALQETLRSAEFWGVADVFGGGFLVTAAKHGKLREAWSRVVRVRTLTRKLRRELRDVAIAEIPKVEVGKFLEFAD